MFTKVSWQKYSSVLVLSVFLIFYLVSIRNPQQHLEPFTQEAYELYVRMLQQQRWKIQLAGLPFGSALLKIWDWIGTKNSELPGRI